MIAAADAAMPRRMSAATAGAPPSPPLSGAQAVVKAWRQGVVESDFVGTGGGQTEDEDARVTLRNPPPSRTRRVSVDHQLLNQRCVRTVARMQRAWDCAGAPAAASTRAGMAKLETTRRMEHLRERGRLAMVSALFAAASG
jgi:hypothetical protein